MSVDLLDIATFLLALAMSAAATHRWRDIAARWGLEDPPNPIVPQHQRPVAHMGGVAVAGAAMATVVIARLALALAGGQRAGRLGAILSVGAGFLALGAADDLVRLRPHAKLIVQILLAAIAASTGLVYAFTHVPILDRLLSAAVIVTLVNGVNLTDVCDGLVSGLAVVVLLALASMDPGSRDLALAAAGAALGFLVFNRPPATVFLGDAGSLWLGFLLAALMLTRPPSGEAPMTRAFGMTLLSAVFVFELVLLTVARTRSGIRFWQGTPDHFSLRLQQAGLSRGATDAAAWSVCAAACVVAVLLPRADRPTQALLGAGAGLLGVAGLVSILRLRPPLRSQILMPGVDRDGCSGSNRIS